MTGPAHSQVAPDPHATVDSGGAGEPGAAEPAEAQRAAVTYWREHWQAQAVAERAALDQGEPWALPLVVRVEKAEPPTHEDAIAASALSVVRLLADPHSAPGGPWHGDLERWMDGRIRKVVRRARGVRWPEVLDLQGVTAEVSTAQVRALLPHPVSQPPVAVAKLQVQGLDLSSRSEETVEVTAAIGTDAAPSADAPVLSIVLAPSVSMTTGKACAQVGHAAQLAMLELDLELVLAWTAAGFPLRIVKGTTADWARILSGDVRAALVQDAGYTEVEPGTRTCAATFG